MNNSHPFFLLICFVGLGGALGAICRASAGRLLQGDFPLATLLVNISGSFLLALLHALKLPSISLHHALWGLGFCGAFTTFSTFILETAILWRSGLRLYACINLSSTVVLCLLASLFGLWLCT